jgi:SAM-dependent methyltransferase
VPLEQAEREELEVAFWADTPSESPKNLDSFTNKMSEARVVLEKFRDHRAIFEAADDILEIGGGQGWVSCLLAREFGLKSSLTTSDIGPSALTALPEWERVFGVTLTGALACRSYEIPVPDGSLDLVFAFAAAHHFGAHRRTLRELERVLRPGGKALYLHEPACRDYLYERAKDRVNRKRPAVPEDVLRYRRIVELAREAGLQAEVIFAPTTTYRGPKETLYYLALQKMARLRDLLPCSVDIIFTKPAAKVIQPRQRAV